MGRWVILGSERSAFAHKTEEVLKRSGVYSTRRIQGNITFSLKLTLQKDKQFIQLSKWTGAKGVTDVTNFEGFSDSHDLDEIDKFAIDPGRVSRLPRILESREGVERLERLNRVVFYSAMAQLPTIFNDVIAPSFFRWYPEGQIRCVASSRHVLRALATIRVLSAAIELANRDYSELEKLGPHRALSDIQSSGVFYPGKYATIPLSLFLPTLHGFFGSKVVLGFIYLLDQPIKDVRKPYPRSGLEFLRSESSGLFRQQLDIDAANINSEAIDKFRLIERSFAQGDLRVFIDSYLKMLNEFMFYLLDPSNFTRSGAGIWAGLAHYRAWLTVDRVAHEVLLMLTDDSSYLRKMALFRILDQLASLESKNAQGQVAFFRKLLLPSSKDDPIKHGLQRYHGSIAKHLAELLEQVRNELSKTVLDAIYVPGRYDAKTNVVRLSGGEEISAEEYVTHTIRELRNTHHGYHTTKFDKYLAINTGNTPDSLPLIGVLAFLAMLAAPHLFFRKNWE